MVSEIIAKAQRQWPHKNIERMMIEAETARRLAADIGSRGRNQVTKPSPESVGSYPKRIKALNDAIRNLHHLEPTPADEGWY
jgi:hypothetical protein